MNPITDREEDTKNCVINSIKHTMEMTCENVFKKYGIITNNLYGKNLFQFSTNKICFLGNSNHDIYLKES